MVCLIVIIGILIRRVGILQRAVVQTENHTNTVTLPAIASLVNTVNQINVEVNKFSPSVQTLGQFSSNLQQAASNIQLTVQSVGPEVAKIAEYSKRYEEMEKEVRNIHSVLIGSYAKGKAGEETLALAMEPLTKMGRVKTRVPVGHGVVEYAIVLEDGKVLPIDCKVVATKEVASLHDENINPEVRAELARDIRKRVKDKITEVQKYIDTDKTSPLAVLALPDSIMETVMDLIPEAVNRNIILLGYSGIPQLIPYFIRIYSFYGVAKDEKKLRECISQVQKEISSLNPEFFSNHFYKPLATLEGAVKRAERAVSGISNAVPDANSQYLDSLESKVGRDDSPTTLKG